MPWINNVKGILEAYLGGQAGGAAVANILYGIVNPSGKLAETIPVKLADNPSYLNFGGGDKVEYREGVFVGYRYYDTKTDGSCLSIRIRTLLYYFLHTAICIFSKHKIQQKKDTVTVSVDVTKYRKRCRKRSCPALCERHDSIHDPSGKRTERF